MENSNISWTHNTWNPWVGCDKVAPECAKCYIGREIRKQTDWQGDGGPRQPWGEVYLTKTWADPYKWQAELLSDSCKRIFTCSLSDFFHAKVDNRRLADDPQAPWIISYSQHRKVAQRARDNGLLKDGVPTWRECAWQVIKDTPNLVYLILTKRPELIASRLPKDWPDAFPNVWLGTSTGCNMTLSKMDSLRKIPVHPKAIRFVSCEPLLEDISQNINLEGFGWMIVGGESGSNPEYLWNPQGDWRAEMKGGAGRRTMEIGWANALLQKARAAGTPFFFKQVTAARSGVGENALGDVLHEFPNPPFGSWAPMGKEWTVLGSPNGVGDEASRGEITTEVS
jgi:protein gp37